MRVNFNLLFEAIFYATNYRKSIRRRMNEFQSSIWSYFLCNKKRTLFRFSISFISIFYLKLFSMQLNKGINSNSALILFQSSIWSYFLCNKNSVDETVEEIKFQSSIWSYFLCNRIAKIKSPKETQEFQSSIWSYFLCNLFLWI